MMMSLPSALASTTVAVPAGRDVAAMIPHILLAVVIIAAALGMVLSRKLIHSALSLLLVMIGVAVEYAILQAPFVFAVQIIVYAGAIMVMFLFIVMMVGSTPESDSVDPLPGQRIAAIIMALSIVIVMAIGIMMVSWQDPAGMHDSIAPYGGNVAALGVLLFSKYVVLFEFVAALLTVAAVGAIVLTLRTRVKNRPTQRDYAEARFRAYAEQGLDIGALPSSGVYASTNAMDVPALLPDGSEAPQTVSQYLVKDESYTVQSAHELQQKTTDTYSALDERSGKDE